MRLVNFRIFQVLNLWPTKYCGSSIGAQVVSIRDFLSSKYGPQSNIYIICPEDHVDGISFVPKKLLKKDKERAS
jgi:hypothetical protein